MTGMIDGDMRAIEIERFGGPEVLTPVRRPIPRPAAGEVLISVEAAGLNRLDVIQRMGRYPPPPGASDLPGLEVAGRIAALGEGVEGWSVGDPVCALMTGGGYAEYAVAPAVQCLPVPDGLSMAEAASLPETTFTVWTNVFDRARFQPGETVLVHGGTSGIGVMAIQMVVGLGGRAIATCGADEKVKVCETLGAARAVNYRTEDFVAATKAATEGKGADIVLDMVGGDYLLRNIEAAAEDGRIVNIAFLQGAKAVVDINAVMRKRLTLTGSALRSRSVAQKGAICEAVRGQVWPLISAGRVRPVIDSIFTLEDAAAAHRRLESPEHVGKVVLRVRAP